MDIFEELHNEHEQVASWLSRLEEGEDQRLLGQLMTGLKSHSKAEEHVFYKRLEDEDAVRDTVLEGYEEHKVILKVLGELDNKGVEGETFQAKLKVLSESVEHHVEEEEGTLFPEARKIITGREPVELYEKFEAEKKRLEG